MKTNVKNIAIATIAAAAFSGAVSADTIQSALDEAGINVNASVTGYSSNVVFHPTTIQDYVDIQREADVVEVRATSSNRSIEEAARSL